jgi:putative transposase
MNKQSFIIGRAGDVTLYDDTVSRRHACLEVEDEGMFLRDLDSRNGTYEIRDKKLVPFASGAVYADQVFAFGECVRSVKQLLNEAGIAGNNLTDTADPLTYGNDHNPLDATQVGFRVPPRKRLSRANIIEMLEQIEDHLAAGGALEEICVRLGITEQRYERWCTEHGETRAEREKSMAALQRENARLRKLVADLSLERETLREALDGQGSRLDDDDESAGEDDQDADASAPNFSLVNGDGKR